MSENRLENEPTPPLVERLRDEDTCWTPQVGYDIVVMFDLMRDAAAEIERLTAALTAAHAARDAAERKALHESRVADTLARQYQDRTDEVYALRALLTTALRERNEARARAARAEAHLAAASVSEAAALRDLAQARSAASRGTDVSV